MLTALAASAADIPMKMATQTPAPSVAALTAADWSGFYIGGHIGGGWAQSRATYANDFAPGPIDLTASGLVAGAQVGYNWQVGRLVYGVEVDGSWGNLDASRTDAVGDDQRIKTNFLGSARLRTGAAIDNVLIFGTIGLAYVRSEFTAIGDVPSPASRDVDAFGIVSGFGAEVALAPNWSLRGEYLYYTVDKRENITTLTDASDPVDYVKIDGVHVVRLAANYRFNGSQARIAAPAVNWSGFTIGAHAGYGRSRMTGIYDGGGDNGSFDIDPKGFLGGGQVGFNFQNGAWVYGIEADGTWSGMDADRADADNATQTLKTTSLMSVRGRVGIAAGEKLYYVTAGWGYGRSKLDVVDAGVPGNVSFDANGAVIGSGVDWAFAPNWSARLEGLTYLFDKSVNIGNLTGDSDPGDFVRQSTVNVIRLGLNYRLGGLN
jgi:outer membrane immunogenic protein